MKKRPVWPRKELLPPSNYAQDVAFLNGHDLTTALKENDWERGPALPRRGPVAGRTDEAAIRRPTADAEHAARRYRGCGNEPRATSSLIGKVTIPVDVATPRRARNELRVPWVLELTLLKGAVTCVRMIITSGPFGTLGTVRGGAHDFSVRSLDEQVAGIEQEGRRARDRARARITLTTGRLGLRCGYTKLRQSYVVQRPTYDAILRLFRRARKQLLAAIIENITRNSQPLPPGARALLMEDDDTPILSGGHNRDTGDVLADTPRPRCHRAREGSGRKAHA